MSFQSLELWIDVLDVHELIILLSRITKAETNDEICESISSTWEADALPLRLTLKVLG